jgi:hypothetical protein
MKKVYYFLLVVLLSSATMTYAQVTDGAYYQIYSAADASNGVFGSHYNTAGQLEGFSWGDASQTAHAYKLNNVASAGVDVWTIQASEFHFISTKGGATTACGTDIISAFLPAQWKLLPDGGDYYLVQSVHNPLRYLYFDSATKRLSTKETEGDVPYDASRAYFQIKFEVNAAPLIALPVTSLSFSSSFLTKEIPVYGENLTGDILFEVPDGITLSGEGIVANGAGKYKRPLDYTYEPTVVNITATVTEGLAGVITITSEGAQEQVIIVKSGLKVGSWYNLHLFHPTVEAFLGANDATTPAIVVPNATALDQVFTFIPVSGNGNLETFKIRNGNGAYLLNDANGSARYGALTGTAADEWTFQIRDVDKYLDYFYAFTLLAGTKQGQTNAYLGHGSTAIGAVQDCSQGPNSKGTYVLELTTGPTAIGNVNANQEYNVFANENRQIVISAKAAANQTVVVYNVAGQKIAEKTLKAADSYINAPEAGVYLVKIGSNGASKAHKVILK